MDHVLPTYKGFTARCKLDLTTMTYKGIADGNPSIQFEGASIVQASMRFRDAVDAYLKSK
jgi:hypothetical protein